MSDLLAVVFWALHITLIIICFRKGKPGMGIGGIFTGGVVSLIGAIRLSKPNSPWAWKNYPPYGPKMAMSRSRFGANSPSPPLTAPRQTSDDGLKAMVESSSSAPELPPIPGLDPIADKIGELSAHFAAAGSSFEILEQSSSSAEVRVSQRFIGSRNRRYRLTLGPRRQVHTEAQDPGR